MSSIESFAPALAEIQEARERLAPVIRQVPLLKTGHADRDLRLKAESLQPMGSFKVRAGVTAAERAASAGATRLVTASAGNFAQGLAFGARVYGLPVEVHVPDTAARSKVDTLRTMGARVIEHSFDEWWAIMQSRETGQGDDAVFVHPVSEEPVLLGNSTIGLEIGDEWPEVDVVIAPFGGGGLSVGIAAGLKALGSTAEVITSEVETSAALAAALTAGEPVAIDRRPSFIDGIGSNRVLDEMWPLITRHVSRSVVTTVDECANAVRELALTHKLIVEGAGASAYAAAIRPEFKGARVAVVLSGSNIDRRVLAEILGTEGEK